MAKCVVDKTGRAWRVSDDEACEMVERGGYYISKDEYRRALSGQWQPPIKQSKRKVLAHAA